MEMNTRLKESNYRPRQLHDAGSLGAVKENLSSFPWIQSFVRKNKWKMYFHKDRSKPSNSLPAVPPGRHTFPSIEPFSFQGHLWLYFPWFVLPRVTYSSGYCSKVSLRKASCSRMQWAVVIRWQPYSLPQTLPALPAFGDHPGHWCLKNTKRSRL